MSQYRAVLIDLDGTLLRSDDTISDYSRGVIEAVQQAGILLMIVTGRSVTGARRPLSDVDLRWPICAYNGAAIYDPVTDRWLRHITLPDAVAPQIIESLDQAQLDFFVYADDIKYSQPARCEEFAQLIARFVKQRIVDKISEIPQQGMTRISAYGPGEQMLPQQQQLKARYPDQIYVACYPLGDLPSFRDYTGYWCDIQPACAGKREALIYLEDEHQIPPEAVVAIGDQFNDRPMLKAAGLAAVMGNAPAEVQQLADRVLGHHDDDGAARFLEELFL